MMQRSLTGNLFEKFLLLEILLGVVGGFSASMVYVLFAVTPAYRVVLYGMAFAIGVMIGLEIPLLLRINEKYSTSLRVNISEILCMDYIGSLIGALVFTYVLLTHFSLPEISYLLGLTNILIGFLSFFLFRYFLERQLFLFLVIIVSLVGVSFGYYKSPDWTRWAEQKYYRDPIILSKTTPFQHVTLTKGKHELNLFINGHLQFSSADEQIYHELLVIPSMVLTHRRERILILGGGDGLALREVLKFPDVQRIDLVDLDPAIIELATQQPELVRLNQAAFMDARVRMKGSAAVFEGDKIEITVQNERSTFILQRKRHRVAEVNLYLIDADRFVRDIQGTYDRIYIDLPDPSTLELAKLYSRDFYRNVRTLLDPEGFVALQATSPLFSKRAFICIGKTLQQAGFTCLPYHDNVPSFGEWGWYLCWQHHLEPKQILQTLVTLSRFPVATRYLTTEYLKTCFIFPKNMLQTPSPLLANSKLNPILWTYYRQDWRRGAEW